MPTIVYYDSTTIVYYESDVQIKICTTKCSAQQLVTSRNKLNGSTHI